MDKSTPFTHPPDNNEQPMWALRDQLAELQRKHEELEAELFDLRGVKTQLGAARYVNAGLQRKYEALVGRINEFIGEIDYGAYDEGWWYIERLRALLEDDDEN